MGERRGVLAKNPVHFDDRPSVRDISSQGEQPRGEKLGGSEFREVPVEESGGLGGQHEHAQRRPGQQRGDSGRRREQSI